MLLILPNENFSSKVFRILIIWHDSNYLVDVGSQPSEFQQPVSLQFLRQRNVVKVIEAIYRVPKSLVIFFFNEEIVVCLIHSSNIELSSVRKNVLEDKFEFTCWTAMR